MWTCLAEAACGTAVYDCGLCITQYAVGVLQLRLGALKAATSATAGTRSVSRNQVPCTRTPVRSDVSRRYCVVQCLCKWQSVGIAVLHQVGGGGRQDRNSTQQVHSTDFERHAPVCCLIAMGRMKHWLRATNSLQQLPSQCSHMGRSCPTTSHALNVMPQPQHAPPAALPAIPASPTPPPPAASPWRIVAAAAGGLY